MATIDRDEVLRAIPTNWCDPILTGPNKVLPDDYAYMPQHIEKVLLAVRARVEAIPYTVSEDELLEALKRDSEK